MHCLSVHDRLSLEIQDDVPGLHGLCSDNQLLGAVVEDDELVAEPCLAVVEPEVQSNPVQCLDELTCPGSFEDPVFRIWQRIQRGDSLRDIPPEDRICGP